MMLVLIGLSMICVVTLSLTIMSSVVVAVRVAFGVGRLNRSCHNDHVVNILLKVFYVIYPHLCAWPRSSNTK